MPLDLIGDFAKYEKAITDMVMTKVRYYMQSPCRKQLERRIKRLQASWDMKVGDNRANVGNSQDFVGQMSYGLVKQQQLARRKVFSANFRSEPLYTVRSIGNTPQENAINMQDVLQANNESIEFRQNTLIPGNSSVSKFGVAVIFVDYCQTREMGWRTVGDPIMGANRKYGIIKNTTNAGCGIVPPLNYFQNPDRIKPKDSDYRGHIERWQFSKLINKVKQNPDLYIRENIEKVIGGIKKQNNINEFFTDGVGNKPRLDIDTVTVNDVVRGQFQVHIQGNEDDETYYYVEMIGDKIIRFQDNPYDMNLCQYVIILCEKRDEFWWGNTPPEYSIGTENNLNLLLGMGIENAYESMKRYVFYNKNAISPALFDQASHSGRIPVDVSREIALTNVLYTYQIPDTSSKALGDAYARMLENDQRFSNQADLYRPTSLGGPSNKTATAADYMVQQGASGDADILEVLSYAWSDVAEAESVILMQFLGNFGPIMVNPAQAKIIRMIQKSGLVGDFHFSIDTSFQQNYSGEIMRYQNIITWLQNLMNTGAQVAVNLDPLIRQVMKMGRFLKVDEAMPDREQIMRMQMSGLIPGVEQQSPIAPSQEQPQFQEMTA